jgi:hypothetical protein
MIFSSILESQILFTPADKSQKILVFAKFLGSEMNFEKIKLLSTLSLTFAIIPRTNFLYFVALVKIYFFFVIAPPFSPLILFLFSFWLPHEKKQKVKCFNV